MLLSKSLRNLLEGLIRLIAPSIVRRRRGAPVDLVSELSSFSATWSSQVLGRSPSLPRNP